MPMWLCSRFFSRLLRRKRERLHLLLHLVDHRRDLGGLEQALHARLAEVAHAYSTRLAPRVGLLQRGPLLLHELAVRRVAALDMHPRR